MKINILVLCLIAAIPFDFGFGSEIVPQKVQIDKAPKSLTVLIDEFIKAMNGERGEGIEMLKLDKNPDFQLIVVPDPFKRPVDAKEISRQYESKILYKIEERYFVLVYDFKGKNPDVLSPAVIWVKGANSWHIEEYSDPLELSIQKLNVKRAKKDVAMGLVPNNRHSDSAD